MVPVGKHGPGGGFALSPLFRRAFSPINVQKTTKFITF